MGLVQTIIRRITTPLLQVGGLAFDAELSVGRGGQVDFTQRRIGAGALISDHSFSLPRTFTLEGGVSGIPQPQNLGRPGASLLGGALDLGFQALENLTGLNFSTRVQDFEARLEALRLRREEIEVISKVVGRVRCVLTDWQAQTTPDMGDIGIYRLSLREVQRAGLTIADATAEALALNGSGGNVGPGGGGPSTAPPGTLPVTP